MIQIGMLENESENPFKKNRDMITTMMKQAANFKALVEAEE